MLNDVPGVHLITMSPRHGVKNTIPLVGTFDELIPTSMVGAIEVYPSAASVPTEFKGQEKGCGLIVIWTQGN